MKFLKPITTSTTITFLLINLLKAAPVVSESFAYDEGTTITGQGGAVDGWAGAWQISGGSDASLETAVAGLSFGDLEVAGGASQRIARFGLQSMSREISAAAQTTLTAQGSTIWFSVLMTPTAPTDPAGSGGFAANSFGTLIFGDTALAGASGTAAAPIGAGGNAIGVSFASTGLPAGDPGRPLFENMLIQGVTYSDGILTQEGATTVGEATHLVVGKVEWSAGDTDDEMSLYVISDLAAPLPDPFVTMVGAFDQSTFNVVSIGDGQTSVFDEVRFGLSLTDILGELPESTTLEVTNVSYDGTTDPGNILLSVTFRSEVGKSYIAYGSSDFGSAIDQRADVNDNIIGEDGTTTIVIDFDALGLNKSVSKFFVVVAENLPGQ